MGMDVYGKQPTDKVGEYFRANVWWWRPLAEMIVSLCDPAVVGKCKHWQSNDGDGLSAAGAKALGLQLEVLLKDGSVDAYVADRNAMLARLPDEKCYCCNGSGVRDDAIGRANGWTEKILVGNEIGHRFKANPKAHPRYGQKGSCNGCNGVGTIPNGDTHYPLDRATVEAFAAFAKASGGFEIC